jgi:O-antigen/teichoic acid export membrane protein
LAQSIAGLLLMLWLHFSTKPNSSGTHTESDLGKVALSSFGWSLYLFNIGSWILSTGDRYIIDQFCNRNDVGIYVANYSFASIPFSMLNGWVLSFTRPRLFTRAAEGTGSGVQVIVASSLALVTTLAVMGVALYWIVGQRLALLVFGAKYWHSFELMITLAAAHVFFCVGHTSSSYFVALKKAGYVSATSLLAAVVNIVVNLKLLPIYGIMGAAWATLIAYGAWSAMMLAGFCIMRTRRHFAPQ